jgi:peptidoglycan/LPS O-acetylase OafA/YrhL
MSIEIQSEIDRAAGLKAAPSAPASSPKTQRIPALDFTKGALVLIMVFYHWANYFIGMQWRYYPYLRFLTPSFIFITGFMISHVYLLKYSATDPRLWKRLLTRGLKLMAVFLVLNVVRIIAVPVLGGEAPIREIISPNTLIPFFVSGNLPPYGFKLVSFSILVPISYLLIVSGVLMLLYRHYKHIFHIACLVLLLVSMIFGYTDARNYNVEFVAIGMLGVLIGFVPIREIDALGRHPYLFAIAYVGYLISIMTWGGPFLLLIFAVLLNVCLLYLVGARGFRLSLVRNEVILLGKYSLFGYISQVAILQLLSKGYQHLDLRSARLPSSLLAAVVLTIMAVEAVDRARAKSRNTDRLYKAIFA